MASLLLQKTVCWLLEKKREFILQQCFLLMKKAKNVLPVTETCVKVRDLRRWNVMQVLRMYG